MSLVNMKELLDIAYEKKYAIPAINVSNIETIIATFEAAEELKSPIILQISPIQVIKQGTTYKELVQIINIIANRFDIKYAIHGDHLTELEECEMAVNGGFSSIMYDGSSLDFLVNCTLTSNAREVANSKECTLEGELGHVGGTEGEAGDNVDMVYTDPNLVEEFVKRSNVDCLAISIGNAHGFYKGKPQLNFEILKEIDGKLKMPLVLHGGTGIPDEDIKKSIELGISKVNFFTEIDYEFTQGFYEEVLNNKGIYMMAAGEVARNRFKEKVKEKIRLTMSEGRM